MTLFAIDTQPSGEPVIPAAIPVTVETPGRRALGHAVPMAFSTLDLKVPTFERQLGLLVKGPGGIPERCRHAVTRGAVRTQRTGVGVFMARRARPIDPGQTNGLATA